jgi:DeoR family transcriptional regulator, fructose operon transcriptional repressor
MAKVVRVGNGIRFAEERQHAILDVLREMGKVTVEELAGVFKVSAPTVRSDLARLEEQGLLRRTHGGAIPASPTLFEPPYAQREVMRHEEKKAIARSAAELVKEGETLILDAGTTTYEIALLLRERRRLTVVTNSIANAHVLMDNPALEVVVVGGSLQAHRRAILGPLSVRFLEAFRVDRAFLAFNGVHAKSGFTVVDFDAAEVKRQMIRCAAEKVVVADSNKIGQIAFAAVGPVTDADLLITDSAIAEEDKTRLIEAGLPVHVADV